MTLAVHRRTARGPEEHALAISMDAPVESIVERIVAALMPAGTIARPGR